MCGRRSFHFSEGFGEHSKVLLVSFLLLCVAVSSLAAWPTSVAKKAEEPIQVLADVLPVAHEVPDPVTYQMPSPTSVEPQMPSTESSQNYAETFLTQLKDVQTQVNDNRKVSDQTKSEMNNLIEKLESYFRLEEIEDAMTEQMLAKLEEVNTLNREQSAQLDRMEMLLQKEKRSKPFLGVGMALGFHDGLPVFGVSGQAGIRLGGSLTASVGGTYMFGDFGNPVWERNLDRVQVTGLIGWEF